MERERRFALDIARQAGQILVQHWGRLTPSQIDSKGTRNPVTDVDRNSEKLLVDAIQGEFPADGILAEEEHRQDLGAQRVWLIDPLDGTVNYTHSHPFVAISIALLVEQQIQVGVVHLPILEESYSAIRGGGTLRHVSSQGSEVEQPCRVSSIDQPNKALCATGFPYVRETSPFNNLAAFDRLFLKVGGLRRCGTASIDMAFVACGIYDAFWEAHLECFDVAAGSLLIEEAGGRVTDYTGRSDWLFGKNIVATNGTGMHAFMLDNMDQQFDPDLRHPTLG